MVFIAAGSTHFLYLKSAMAGFDILTDNKIKSFYDDYISIQTGNPDKAISFLKEHLSDDFNMSVNVISKIEGSPQQEQIVNFNKEKMLEETKRGMEVIKTSSVDYKIKSIDISDDGKVAKVIDSRSLDIELSIGSYGMPTKFIGNRFMICNTTLYLNSNGSIMIKDSTCNSKDNIRSAE